MHENDKEEELNENTKQDDSIIDENIISEAEKTEPEPKQAGTGNPTVKFLYPAIVLASISVIVALLLAVLNAFTADVIAERKVDEQNEAIREMFGDINLTQPLDIKPEAPVNEVMRIYDKSNEFIGYCVSVSPQGFGGKMDIYAAVNPDGEIIKIKILDMSETAGIGTKVQAESFLEQFAGKKQGITAKSGGDNSIDTISGATISSSAVLNGINAALDAVNAISAGEEATSEIEPAQAEGDGGQE